MAWWNFTENRERKKRLEAAYTTAHLKFSSNSWWSVASYSGTRGGVKFVQNLEPAGRSSPAYLKVSVPTPLDEDLTVTRESGSDAFFKRIGFSVEVQTGDAAFDQEFYLSSRSPEFIRALFAPAQNREAVRALFAQGFDQLELQGGSLTARKKGEKEPLEVEALFRAVESLARLRATAQAARALLPPPSGLTTTRLLWINGGVMVLLLVPSFFAISWARPVIGGEISVLWDTLRWSAAGILAASMVLASVLRGRPNAHREFAVGFLTLLFGIPVGVWGAAMLVNERLDVSEAVVHEARLLDKRETHGKRDHYYLTLASWHPGGDSEEIEVSRGTYSSARPRQLWIVRTRAGRMGYEWVESLRRAQ